MNIEQWFKDNDHIWKAFERQAILIARSGHKHYSARTIVEYLRHHSALQEKDGMWKINDHVTPYLSRRFMGQHPQYIGFFETRKMS